MKKIIYRVNESTLMPKARSLMEYFRFTPLHPQWLLGNRELIVDLIQNFAKGRVLDIGCADRWAESYIAEGCEYISIDYPKTGGNLYESRPDIFADASEMPFADRSIDTVLIFDVIEHLKRPECTFSEISRVLKEDGTLLISVPFLYPLHDAPHDYQRYTNFGLEREIERSNMHKVTISPSLGSAETAGALACIALSGMVVESLKKNRFWGSLSLPLLLVAPVINVLFWTLGKILPSWPAFTAGYVVVVKK